MSDHEICEQARRTRCVCGARHDQHCTCGPRGVHYARVTRAYRLGWVTRADFAQAIADAEVITGMSILLDPEAAT